MVDYFTLIEGNTPQELEDKVKEFLSENDKNDFYILDINQSHSKLVVCLTIY